MVNRDLVKTKANHYQEKYSSWMSFPWLIFGWRTTYLKLFRTICKFYWLEMKISCHLLVLAKYYQTCWKRMLFLLFVLRKYTGKRKDQKLFHLLMKSRIMSRLICTMTRISVFSLAGKIKC